MTNTEETDVIDIEKVFPKLKLLQGGKDGPIHNWLAELQAGDVFAARARASKEVDWNLYRVVFRSLPELVLLEWKFPDGKCLDYYVDPMRFSKVMELGKVLGNDERGAEAPEEIT